MVDVLETDVLVIGGGAAGSNAVLKAADRGAKVTMVVKGLLGKSGCSIFAAHIPYRDTSTDHDTSTEQKARDFQRFMVRMVRYYNHYLTDQEYCRRLRLYMRAEFFADLERLGLYWRRDAEGHLMAIESRTPALVAHKQGATGPIIMDKRRREILRRGIPVHEECAVTSLVTDGERVVGATVFDYRRGRFFAIAAKSTILATGHSDYLATRSTGTREQSADGIAMAVRVGVELANLEIQWWHVSDVLEPRAWMRYHLYPNPLMGTEETSRLYNSVGEIFFEQKTHSPGASAPYYEQIRRLAREVMAGKARWDGGYYSGYDHIPAEITNAYQHQAKVWSKLGLDIGKDRIECGITWHMRQGGINVDTERMETNLPGPLYRRRHRLSLSRRRGPVQLRRQGGGRSGGGGGAGGCSEAAFRAGPRGGGGAGVRLPARGFGRHAADPSEAPHPGDHVAARLHQERAEAADGTGGGAAGTRGDGAALEPAEHVSELEYGVDGRARRVLDARCLRSDDPLGAEPEGKPGTVLPGGLSLRRQRELDVPQHRQPRERRVAVANTADTRTLPNSGEKS